MTIVKICLYEDSLDIVLVLASSDEAVQKIKDAANEFALLNKIYVMRDEAHPRYTEAVEAVEAGLSDYLDGKGFTVPCTETVFLTDMGNVGESRVEAARNGDYPCEGCADILLSDEKCANEAHCMAWKIYVGEEN